MEIVQNSLKRGPVLYLNPWEDFQYKIYRNSKDKGERSNTSYKVVRKKVV